MSAAAVNVTIPEALRWTDTRRGQEFQLTTLNVRLLPDGHLAVKAYGRPVGGGRGAYVSFPVPDEPGPRHSGRRSGHACGGVVGRAPGARLSPHENWAGSDSPVRRARSSVTDVRSAGVR
ncbi:hypothetical protein GCM10010267_41140 [Streptomyces griseorubens]|nr:hypothetical protein GCM10010267_41140 [Streptomyces griseorubens]